jgi:hypothetical protein
LKPLPPGAFSRRLDWLDRVSRDPNMRGLPTAVAVQLASRYINSKTGRAWPGQLRLAKTLGAHRRSIQLALKVLVKAGYLTCERGGTRHETNTYGMRVKGEGADGAAPTPPSEQRKGGAETGFEAAMTPFDERSARRTNTEKNTGSELGEERAQDRGCFDEVGKRRSSAQHSSFSSGESKSSNKNRASLLRADWFLGPPEIKIAQQLAGWEQQRAESEFDHFCAHHKAKGTRSHDWVASWESWCRNGYKFDQGASSRSGSSRRALSGLQRWLARQGNEVDLD